MNLYRSSLNYCRQTRLYGVGLGVFTFALYTVRRFFADRIDNAVAALTYATLLAFVPLIVIAFAILSNFAAFDNAKESMEEVVFEAIIPEAGAALRDYLSDFTHNAGNLTTIGVVGLAITALFLLSSIESTFNHIWRVERTRPLFIRLLVFWAILTLGPMLIGASLTLTSDAVTLAAEFEPGLYGVSQYAPGSEDHPWLQSALRFIIATAGFTGLFIVVPARPVMFRHALVGALVASVGFEILAWVFNSFLFSGATYKTIYGAVAAVPIFLIWVYSCWIVVVLGAMVAACLPDWRAGHSAVPLTHAAPSVRLEAAVALLAELHRRAQDGGTLPEQAVMDATTLESRAAIFETLAAKGYLVESETGGVALIRDLHRTTLSDLATDIGVTLGGSSGAGSVSRHTGSVHRILGRLAEAEAEVLNVPIAEVIDGPGDDRGPRLVSGTHRD